MCPAFCFARQTRTVLNFDSACFLQAWQISATECKVLWKLVKHSEFSLCTWTFLSVNIVYMIFNSFGLASSGIHSLYFLNCNTYRDDCVKIFSELQKTLPIFGSACVNYPRIIELTKLIGGTFLNKLKHRMLLSHTVTQDGPLAFLSCWPYWLLICCHLVVTQGSYSL